MDRLTSARVNGIKTGYWSPAKKEELVQRLGKYEDTGLEPEEIKRLVKDTNVHSKWISVKDKLPETDDKVLCCTITAKGLKNIIIGYYAERWCCGMNSNVIAWQPLPEPPEEVDNG